MLGAAGGVGEGRACQGRGHHCGALVQMIVTIYSVFRDCPWSHELKSLLRDNNVEYKEYFPYPELAEEMVQRYNSSRPPTISTPTLPKTLNGKT